MPVMASRLWEPSGIAGRDRPSADSPSNAGGQLARVDVDQREPAFGQVGGRLLELRRPGERLDLSREMSRSRRRPLRRSW